MPAALGPAPPGSLQAHACIAPNQERPPRSVRAERSLQSDCSAALAQERPLSPRPPPGRLQHDRRDSHAPELARLHGAPPQRLQPCRDAAQERLLPASQHILRSQIQYPNMLAETVVGAARGILWSPQP